VHRHYGLCAAGDRRDGGRRVQQKVLVAVGEHKGRTGAEDGFGRGHERVGRGDYLVARSDADSAQRKLDRVCAVTDADAVLDSAELRVLALEGLDLWSKNERCVRKHSFEPGLHVIGNAIVLQLQIDERYWVSHVRTSRPSSAATSRAALSPSV
jgi:hypothetical protein